jgi:hypothetical protein
VVEDVDEVVGGRLWFRFPGVVNRLDGDRLTGKVLNCPLHHQESWKQPELLWQREGHIGSTRGRLGILAASRCNDHKLTAVYFVGGRGRVTGERQFRLP